MLRKKREFEDRHGKRSGKAYIQPFLMQAKYRIDRDGAI
jgi:hypothetical protein